MKKTNLLVLLCSIILIATVAALAAFMPQTRLLPDDAPSVAVSSSSDTPPTSVPSAEAAPAASSAPVQAYLVVTVGGMLYEPLPLAGEGAFTISQDENTFNTIRVTPDSIWMEHSSCDNQDCVDQGTVSLENMDTRVLSNMIICLPNEVVLELHTPETLTSTFGITP